MHLSNLLLSTPRALVFALASLITLSLHASEKSAEISLTRSDRPTRVNAVHFDAGLLRQGKFTYRLSIKGETIGLAVIEIRSTTPGEYRISFESKDVEQNWTSDLGRQFEPKSASLKISTGRSPYSMVTAYSANKATGTEYKDGLAMPFSVTFDKQVVDQRVDWAAMMAAQFPSTGVIEFHVFDPSTSLSRLVGTITESRPVEGPFGTLPVVRLDYTIHKDSHAETYSVLASRDHPRMMLREDMPGELVSMLVAVED